MVKRDSGPIWDSSMFLHLLWKSSNIQKVENRRIFFHFPTLANNYYMANTVSSKTVLTLHPLPVDFVIKINPR